MSSKLISLFFFLGLSILISSCGDLSGKKVVKRDLDTSQFEINCELDLDKFADIFDENISPQIRCLGESLNLFIRVAKTDKPGYLSRTQLEWYLAKHRPDVKPEIIEALKSVFDLGHLITGENPDFISKEIVDKVINFALIFNQEAALNFGPIFQNESPATFALHQNHRNRVSRATKSIIQAIRLIYNPNREGQVHKLNIVDLLESFSTDSTRPAIEKVKKVLFLKKVILGGENKIITHHELEKLILNFNQLILIGLDIVRYNHIVLNQESLLQLLKKDIDDFYDIFTQGELNNRDQEVLFTINEAIEAGKVFISEDDLDLEKFRNLIVEAKKITMKGNADEVKTVELKNLFYHAKSLLKSGTIFHRIYDKFKVQLASTRPVEETIDFDEYRHTYPEHQEELNQFERIAKKYRFMKGEFYSSYYISGFKRNADAFFEIALFEYGLKLLLEKYGSPSPNSDSVGGFSINQEQMQKLVLKFEPELIELDLLIPQRAIRTADDISLLGTLFQFQSDQNGVLDVNEAAEFGISLFSSLNMSKDIHGFMKEVNCEMDEFNRTEPACFKANFWTGFCKYYKSYFPLLFSAFNAPKNCGVDELRNASFEAPSWVTPELQDFLMRSSDASRTCNFYTDGDKEEIYYSQSDIMTILLVIMHTETTILRWDTNNNNYMDPSEVEKSYEIYSPALDGFLEPKGNLIKKLKKQIFLYMIKFGEVPDEKQFKKIWKFIKFLLSFNKKANAYRTTIASILDVIGKENAKLQTGPTFDCNLMRDPDNIPHTPIPTVLNKPLRHENSDENPDHDLVSLGQMMDSYSEGEKDLLKAQLVAFSEDMDANRINKISQMRQAELRVLFETISKNTRLMSEVNSVVLEGSELHKIGVAVYLVLQD